MKKFAKLQVQDHKTMKKNHPIFFIKINWFIMDESRLAQDGTAF